MYGYFCLLLRQYGNLLSRHTRDMYLWPNGDLRLPQGYTETLVWLDHHILYREIEWRTVPVTTVNIRPDYTCIVRKVSEACPVVQPTPTPQPV